MYTIRVDGQEIYSPALSLSEEYQIISPHLQLEINTAGALSFILPPGHAAYNSIRRMKSVVTMEWDGVEIFRGRVLEEKTDFDKLKEVYCEGDLSFLLDSIQRPFTFSGTKQEYIAQLISNHNTQVDEEKHFTVGDMSILDDSTHELECEGYIDTLSAIRAVLEEEEGYLRTRYESGGPLRLDFVSSSGANNGQAIEFGVNLLDLDQKVGAEEIFTVLLPIGGMLEDGTTVTIETVNDGKDTIESAEGIAKYGRIVKTYAFDDVTDPAELRKLAQDKLAAVTEVQSLTLKAVDIHLLDDDAGMILPGCPVLIHTAPHDIDKEDICTAVDLDLENPEKSVYTFGKQAETQTGASALIAKKVEKHTHTVQKLYKHYTETDYTVKIHTGLLDSHETYIAESKIEMDGINARLDLTVTKDGLISAINMSPEAIKISAGRIELDGTAIIKALEGTKVDVSHVDTYSLYATDAFITLLDASTLTVDGDSVATQTWVENLLTNYVKKE